MDCGSSCAWRPLWGRGCRGQRLGLTSEEARISNTSNPPAGGRMRMVRAATQLGLLMACVLSLTSALPAAAAEPATRPALPAIPAPLNVPPPGPETDQPYAPQPILQGGVVVTLFPPDSRYL